MASSIHTNTEKNAFITLPVELIGYIFLLSRPQSFPSGRLNLLDPREYPRVLTHVCRQWRAIAISTPHLWNEFDLLIDKPVHEATFTQTLAWAGALPLHVILNVTMRNYRTTNFDSAHFALFLSYCHRVSHLELRFPLTMVQALSKFAMQQSCVPHFAALRYLRASDRLPHHSEGFPVQMFATARALEVVDFANISSSEILFPEANLVSFSGIIERIEGWGNFLRAAPRLKKCTVNLDDIRRSAQSPLRAPHHDVLENLELSAGFTTGTVDVLRGLVAPSLRSATFKTPKFLDAGIFSELLHNSPLLSSIAVNASELTPDAVLWLFPPLVAFTKVSIMTCSLDFARHFFDKLGSDPTFLPRMETLEFINLFSSDMAEFVDLAGAGLTNRRTVEADAETGAPSGISRFRWFEALSMYNVPTETATKVPADSMGLELLKKLDDGQTRLRVVHALNWERLDLVNFAPPV